MNDQFLTELQNVMGGSGIFMEEPMKKHTTFRVGGPADVLVQPDETALVAILALCRQYHVSYSFIGNGSNLLVGDKGIRGVVIEMTDPMGNIEVDGTKITAQAGAMLSKIANTAASNGLGGMEFAAGIPGSVGGAVVMNAGAYGGEMKDIIEKYMFSMKTVHSWNLTEMRSTWVTGIAVFQRKNILLQKLFWNLCRAMRRKSVPK